jgi:hypothetical protein
MCLPPHPDPGGLIAVERTNASSSSARQTAGSARTVGQEGVITTPNLVDGIRPTNWTLVPPDCPRDGEPDEPVARSDAAARPGLTVGRS